MDPGIASHLYILCRCQVHPGCPRWFGLLCKMLNFGCTVSPETLWNDPWRTRAFSPVSLFNCSRVGTQGSESQVCRTVTHTCAPSAMLTAGLLLPVPIRCCRNPTDHMPCAVPFPPVTHPPLEAWTSWRCSLNKCSARECSGTRLFPPVVFTSFLRTPGFFIYVQGHTSNEGIRGSSIPRTLSRVESTEMFAE